MKPVVVDASVVAKWFISEVHSDAALRLLDGEDELIAPDLLYAELGNILWKKQRRGELQAEQAIKTMGLLRLAPIRWYASEPLAESALAIGCELARSFYDSLYLALAVSRNCQLVTADRRLYNGLHGTRLQTCMLWIEALSDEAKH